MKTDLTRQAEKCLWHETNRMGVFGCFEVTIGWSGTERVDYITYSTDNTIRCYEIKVSFIEDWQRDQISFEYFGISAQVRREAKFYTKNIAGYALEQEEL